MKKILTLIFAVAPLVALAADPFGYTDQLRQSEMGRQVPDDEEDVYFLLSDQAEKAIAQGDYRSAIDRIHEAMEYDPTNPGNVLLLSNLGAIYARLDMDSLALASYDQAIEQAPTVTAIYNNRGRLKLRMGDESGALADFTEVVRQDSLNVDARYYRGMMALFGGDAKGAEADFQVLQTVDPQGYSTSVALSSLYSMTGRPLKAVPYYEKLIVEDPSPEFFGALAQCYLELEDLSNASATITKGFELFPSDADLYYYRAWLNRERHMLDDAKADANQALKLGINPYKVATLFAKPKK